MGNFRMQEISNKLDNGHLAKNDKRLTGEKKKRVGEIRGEIMFHV